MNLLKQNIIKGYAAFTKEGKGLYNHWSGGYQTGTNVQSLTDNLEKVTIESDKSKIETYIIWFNNSHKNKVEFEIKEVEYKETKTLAIN